jgi:hypothetical protein
MFSYTYSLEHLCRIVKRAHTCIILAVIFCAGTPAYQGWAQAASTTAGPDVLTLANGDHLAGKLLSEANGIVTFHSDGAGDLNLTWDKIKSIQTAGKFAVIQQGQRVSRKTANSQVLRGVVVAEEGKVRVDTGATRASKEIAQPAAQYVIDEDTYTKTVNGHPGWGHGWAGALSAGVADDPAFGSKKNSFQFSAGITYALK